MKKSISILLVLLMLVSLSFNSFALEEEDAAKDLSKYGIMSGFPDGSFGLDQTITRGQITKMIVTALGFEDMDMGRSVFADVPDTHWAKNHINYAQFERIVGGFADGTFKPDESVTTFQAIKMVVCMMSYDKYALGDFDKNFYAPEGSLRYPYDYISIAKQQKLLALDYVPEEKPATRGFVATLISTALDLPIAKGVGYSTSGMGYALMDGTKGRDKITLRSELEK